MSAEERSPSLIQRSATIPPVGGRGGAGGQGGSGPIAAVFGLGGSLGGGTGITTGFGTGSSGLPTSLGGGGTGINTGGPGGNGGNGATGQGGGSYIGGGTVTLINDTLAGDVAQIGAAGAAGKGGPAGTGKLTGGMGVAGSAGLAGGGGMYISNGTVSLLNSTVADNMVDTTQRPAAPAPAVPAPAPEQVRRVVSGAGSTSRTARSHSRARSSVSTRAGRRPSRWPTTSSERFLPTVPTT